MKRHESRTSQQTWIIYVLLAALLSACNVSANPSRRSGERNQQNRQAASQEAEITPIEGPIAWQDDFETGDLSLWPTDKGAGGESDSGLCSRPSEGVSDEQAHSGQYSLKATINTRLGTAGCRQFRKHEVGLGQPLYYSAWFYFPEQIQVNGFWNLFQFKANQNGESGVFWKLDVDNRPTGEMMWILVWDGPIEGPTPGMHGRREYPHSLMTLPVGQWTHVEVYLKQSSGFDGEIIVWQDGVELFNMSGVRTKFASGYQNWSVNNYGNNLSPASVTLYIDDVVISTERIGP